MTVCLANREGRGGLNRSCLNTSRLCTDHARNRNTLVHKADISKLLLDSMRSLKRLHEFLPNSMDADITARTWLWRVEQNIQS